MVSVGNLGLVMMWWLPLLLLRAQLMLLLGMMGLELGQPIMVALCIQRASWRLGARRPMNGGWCIAWAVAGSAGAAVAASTAAVTAAEHGVKRRDVHAGGCLLGLPTVLLMLTAFLRPITDAERSNVRAKKVGAPTESPEFRSGAAPRMESSH